MQVILSHNIVLSNNKISKAASKAFSGVNMLIKLTPMGCAYIPEPDYNFYFREVSRLKCLLPFEDFGGFNEIFLLAILFF